MPVTGNPKPLFAPIFHDYWRDTASSSGFQAGELLSHGIHSQSRRTLLSVFLSQGSLSWVQQ